MQNIAKNYQQFRQKFVEYIKNYFNTNHDDITNLEKQICDVVEKRLIDDFHILKRLLFVDQTYRMQIYEEIIFKEKESFTAGKNKNAYAAVKDKQKICEVNRIFKELCDSLLNFVEIEIGNENGKSDIEIVIETCLNYDEKSLEGLIAVIENFIANSNAEKNN